jgi:pimeloyl-ACP methyl ester carboxylesterase
LTNTDARKPTLLLVHGAWHGTWCWKDLETEFAESGWATKSLELPSAMRTTSPPEPLPGMHADAQAIRTALAHIDDPVVVVAHSYGGTPVTQAIGSAANVISAIYLAAFMLDVGESVLSVTGEHIPHDNAGVMPVTSAMRTAFYSDVSGAQASLAMSELVPHSHRSFAETVTRAGWREVPSTYVVCTEDQSLPSKLQERFALRAGTVERLACGHSPFLSMPADLARLLGRLALASPATSQILD